MAIIIISTSMVTKYDACDCAAGGDTIETNGLCPTAIPRCNNTVVRLSHYNRPSSFDCQDVYSRTLRGSQ